MTTSLADAQECYQRALMLQQPADVIAQTRRGLGLLDGTSSPEADTLRLQLLDLELHIQSSESYLPPPADTTERFAQLAAQSNQSVFQARALYYQGIITWASRSFMDGVAALRQAVEALAACGDVEGQFSAVSSLGLFTSVTGNLDGGIALMRDGLALYDQLDPARRELPAFQLVRARLMVRIGLNLFDLDYFDEALSWLAQAREVYERIGRLFGCTTEYAQLYARVGWWQEAEHWAQLGIRHGPTESDRAYAQTLYGFTLGQQGKIAQAIAEVEQALSTVTRLNLERWQIALASVYMGDLLLADGPAHDLARAEAYSDVGFEIGEAGVVHYGSIYGLVNKARIALEQGDAERAAALAVDAADRVRARKTLTLVREEEVLYWEYRALQAAGRDGRSSLADAHERLQVAASRMSDPAMRDSFLSAVPVHRAIMEAF